jgi:hypothetical protein
MRSTRIAAAVCALALALAPDAMAQVCRGSLPFASGTHVQVGGEVAGMHGSTLNRGHAETFTAALGNNKHYGRFNVARYSFSDYDQVSNLVGGGVGDTYQLMDRSRLVVCPEANLYFERSELIIFPTSPPVPTRDLSLEVAGRVGTLQSVRGAQTMLFAGGGMFLSRHSMTTGGGPIGTITETSFDRGWFVETGAGVVLGRRLSITGAMQVPVNVPGGFNAFSITTTLGLGRSRP